MFKNISFLFFILAVVIVLQGCNTVKGAGYGARKDVEAVKYEMMDANGKLHRTDRWLEKNLW